MFVFVYIIALLIVFLLPRYIPANPFATLLGRIISQYIWTPELIPEVYARVLSYFAVDKPVYEQFLTFLKGAFVGDFGISISMFPRSVSDIIMMALPWTLALMVPATIVSWTLGNYIGAYASYKRGKTAEKIILGYSFIASFIPQYWLAMMLIFVFAYGLRLFPAFGGSSIPPSLSLSFITDFLWHYTLPFLSIVIISIAGWMRSMRFVATPELGSDYIQFSESLGTRDGILFRYVLRNSLLPQVTGLALSLGSAIAGQALVEAVFGYPGLGYYLQMAIGSIDYPLIQGIFVILIATTYLANFLVDFIYVIIDPRIRIGGGR
ncbi:MAG: ABC transporter permease [Ignisphaera sp.]